MGCANGGEADDGAHAGRPVNDDQLKESLLELYEAAPCGYLFAAPDGTLLRANRTFLDWTGYTRAELVGGRRFQDLLTVPGKLFYENQYAPLLRLRGAVNEVAFDLVRPGRAPLPVLVSSVLRHDAAGQPTLVASTIFDATARRTYEQELLRARREAEQLAAIVDASDDAILSAAADGAIRTWNPGAQRLLGYRAADVADRPLTDVLPLVGAEWERLAAELRAGRAIQLETVAVDAAGERIDVSAALTPHLGPLGELEGVSSIMRDIRERKALERLQQEFLAMASHELRNPLASIKGHAQLMQRRGRYNETGIATIVAEADQLDGLIEDVLLASQAAAGRLALRLEDVDLADEVRAAVAGQTRPDSPPMRVEAPTQPVVIRADPRRLRQVFANLLTNAVKYSPSDGEIVVAVSATAEGAAVEVRDRGVGIAPAALPHLFDRFYRVRATADRASGLGLGLYITRELVRAHGGEIAAASEPGQGSTFTVTLPRDAAPGERASG